MDSNPFRNSLRTPLVPFSLRENLVGPSGLEPPTSCLSGTRSNHLSYEPVCTSFSEEVIVKSEEVTSSLFSFTSYLNHVGGDDGIRTHDPLLAGQVLSQLSYTPIFEVMGNSEEWRGYLCFSLFLCHKRSFKIEQRTQKTLLSRLATNIVFVCADSP